MRVLFVIPNLRRSGAERMVVNICNELSKNEKNSVAIYLINNQNEYGLELNENILIDGGEISFHLSPIKRNRIENSKYIRFVQFFNPDVIHSHLYFADILAHSFYFKNVTYFTSAQ